MNSEFAGIEDSPAFVFLVMASTVVLGWLLWGTIAYIIGSRVMGGEATHRMLLRSLGRETCRRNAPACTACPLRRDCPSSTA